MDALEHITIQGFKSIRSIDVKLGPINVLIGANGSGKSNFLGVFQLLQSVGQGELRSYVQRAGGAEKLLHFGSETTSAITADLGLVGRSYELRLMPTADDGLFVGNETLSSTPDAVHLERWKRGTFGGWRQYHLANVSLMQKTAYVHDNRFLKIDGSNLAAFLYLLRVRQSDSYKLIRATIQSVAPFFEKFALEPLALDPDTIKLEWKHKGSDLYFGASSLSDGTLRFIALATLFLQPQRYRPSLILVDEPELGLHPHAIGLLASLIRQASVDTQVIVSTQSSRLLDYFQPDEVLVADRENGATVITRPDAIRLASWLEDYSLGQLWEKNELGGRPVRE